MGNRGLGVGATVQVMSFLLYSYKHHQRSNGRDKLVGLDRSMWNEILS